MVRDLRDPLLLHVLKGRGGHGAEADQEHVRLRVGQRSQPTNTEAFMAERLKQTRLLLGLPVPNR